MATKNYDYLFKLLVIGDSGVGKSCILSRFTDNTYSDEHYSTIGVDFKIKTIDIGDKLVKLQVWDTAGQERFRTITSSYYRGAHGIAIVYDVTNQNSFESIRYWVQEIKRYAGDQMKILIIGNKSDDKSRRKVSYESGHQTAKLYGYPFIETSAKESANIQQAFIDLATSIKADIDFNKINRYDYRVNTIAIPKKRSRC